MAIEISSTSVAVKTDSGPGRIISPGNFRYLLCIIYSMTRQSFFPKVFSWNKYSGDREIKFKIMQNISGGLNLKALDRQINFHSFRWRRKNVSIWRVCAKARFKANLEWKFHGSFGALPLLKLFIVVYGGSCVGRPLFDRIIVTASSSVHLNN